MLYPKTFLEALGEILLQIDYIGPRYLEGNKDPMHFLSCKYVRPFKLHLFFRISSQKATQVLNIFYALFFRLHLPLPDIVQMDNDSSFRGCIDRKFSIGRIIRWLCVNGIIPLFNAPRSPWNNGSVEGGNSVFDRKVWTKYRFQDLQEVDVKLKEFNQAYETYLIPDYHAIVEQQQKRRQELLDPRKVKAKQLKLFSQPYLYLLRIVKEQYGKCQVEALHHHIRLPDKYKGQFVLIQINLLEQKLKILQEINGETVQIYQCNFYVDV